MPLQQEKAKNTITDTVAISGTISPEKHTIGTFNIADMASGETDFNITLNRYAKTKNWAVNANANANKTALKLPPLLWSKPQNTRGLISANGVWTNDNMLIIKKLKFRGDASTDKSNPQSLSVTGSAKYNLNNSQILSVNVNNLSSDKFDLNASFGKQKSKTYLAIKGAKADIDYITQNLAHLSSGDEKSGADITVQLDTVTSAERGSIKNLNVKWIKNIKYTQHFDVSFQQKQVKLKNIDTPSTNNKPIIKSPKTVTNKTTPEKNTKPVQPVYALSNLSLLPNGQEFIVQGSIHDTGDY